MRGFQSHSDVLTLALVAAFVSRLGVVPKCSNRCAKLRVPFNRLHGIPKLLKGSLNDWFLLAKELHDTVDFYDKCRGIARNDLDPRK